MPTLYRKRRTIQTPHGEVRFAFAGAGRDADRFDFPLPVLGGRGPVHRDECVVLDFWLKGRKDRVGCGVCLLDWWESNAADEHWRAWATARAEDLAEMAAEPAR